MPIGFRRWQSPPIVWVESQPSRHSYRTLKNFVNTALSPVVMISELCGRRDSHRGHVAPLCECLPTVRMTILAPSVEPERTPIQ